MRTGRLARRRHQQQEGAPLPDQPGRVQVLPAQTVAVAAWAEVVEPAAPVDATTNGRVAALWVALFTGRQVRPNDHRVMCSPSGTSSADRWYRDIVVVVAHAK
jgi:hypothetical protein